MSPQEARFRLSASPLALSHGVARQLEGKTPSTWKIWSSRGTVMTTRRTAKEATGISVISGSPSEGSSPRHLNNHRSGWYGPTGTEKK